MEKPAKPAPKKQIATAEFTDLGPSLKAFVEAIHLMRGLTGGPDSPEKALADRMTALLSRKIGDLMGDEPEAEATPAP